MNDHASSGKQLYLNLLFTFFPKENWEWMKDEGMDVSNDEISFFNNINCVYAHVDCKLTMKYSIDHQVGKESPNHKSARIIHQIGEFLSSSDLANMVLTCKDWQIGLQWSSYSLFFDAPKHRHPEALSSFLSFFHRASSIRFHQVANTDPRMDEFPRLLENFKTIELYDCSLAKDFSQIPLPNLQTFVLHNIQIPGHEIAQRLEPWRQLQHLTLSQCIHLRDVHFEAIIQQCCPHLQIFTVQRALQLLSPSLCTADNSTILAQTKDGTSSRDANENVLFCRLRSLCLIECPLLHLSNHFSVYDTRQSEDNEFRSDSNSFGCIPLVFPNLTFLNLSATAVKNIHHLLQHNQKHASSLKTLVLDKCLQLPKTFQVNHAPILQSLSLRQCARLTLIELCNCPNLQNLNVSMCESLEQLCLSQVPQLQSLSLVMLQKLVSLKLFHCSSLVSLNCTGCMSLLDNMFFRQKVNLFGDYLLTREESVIIQDLLATDQCAEDNHENQFSIPESIAQFVAMVCIQCPRVDILHWMETSLYGTQIFSLRQTLIHKMKKILLHGNLLS